MASVLNIAVFLIEYICYLKGASNNIATRDSYYGLSYVIQTRIIITFVILLFKCCRIIVFNSRVDMSREKCGRLYVIKMINEFVQTEEWVL